MRYMMLFKPGMEAPAPPSPEHLAAMGKLIEGMTRAGVLISTGGLQQGAPDLAVV